MAIQLSFLDKVKSSAVAMKRSLGDDFDYSTLQVEITIPEEDLYKLDEEMFYRQNPNASASDFVHGNMVMLVINGISYLFKAPAEKAS